MWTSGSTNEPLGGLMTFLHFPRNGSLCTIIQTEELPWSLRQHSLCGPVPCLYLLQCMRPQVDPLEGGFWCPFRVMNQFTWGKKAIVPIELKQSSKPPDLSVEGTGSLFTLNVARSSVWGKGY